MDKSKRKRDAFRNWLNSIKQAQGCMVCGTHEGSLHHHHVDPSTKLSAVTKMHNYCLAKVLDEIAKCTVLCTSCHTIHHNLNGGTE